MNKVQSIRDSLARASTGDSPQQSLEGAPETAQERVTRLYAHPGGPLIGWLLDECNRRGQMQQEMARELGVTCGYINQLRSGLRKTEHISRDFAVSCARYLGVPPVAVMIVSGRVSMQDFVSPTQSPELVMQRAFDAMLADPAVRAALPLDVSSLDAEARKALVLLYSDTLGHDVLGLRELPETVRWLQRAAVIHDESEAELQRGHRDVLYREA